MRCTHTDSEYCDGPAVRFALFGRRDLVTRCQHHVDDAIDVHGRWIFQDHEISEQEAEVFAVQES